MADQLLQQQQSLQTQDVVAAILRHVPTENRLKVCALLSKVWAAAAWAATDSLEMQLGLPKLYRPRNSLLDKTSDTFINDWIGRHGQGLTSLKLEQHQCREQQQQEQQLGQQREQQQQQAPMQRLLTLPCRNLRVLQLSHTKMPVPASPSSSQQLLLLSPLTALTRLDLHNVVATGGPRDNLMALSALTALQHLEVDSSGRDVATAHLSGLLRLPACLIPHLTQVSRGCTCASGCCQYIIYYNVYYIILQRKVLTPRPPRPDLEHLATRSQQPAQAS